MIHTYVAVEYKYPYASDKKEIQSMFVDYPIRTTSDFNNLQKDIIKKFDQACPIIFMKEFEDD